MNPTRLRRIARQYGTPGVLFVGAVMLLQSLWRRKPLLLATVGVTALGLGFLLPTTCNLRARNVVDTAAVHFTLEEDVPGSADSVEPHAVRVIDLGVLPGGTISEATSVNDKGQVAGVGDISEDSVHAFAWNGKMHDLKTLGGELSIGLGINNDGQIIGWSDDKQGRLRSFVWQNGKIRDIGDLGGGFTVANGINNRGGVVGLSVTRDYLGHSFLWQDGKMRDIGTPKGTDLSIAYDVNDSGTVVGFALNAESDTGSASINVAFNRMRAFFGEFALYTPLQTTMHLPDSIASLKIRTALSGYDNSEVASAFVWKNGNFTELRGTRDEAAAVGINNKGQIIGLEFSEEEDTIRGIVWENNKARELPMLDGGIDSLAVDISDSGVIVGSVLTEEEALACIWVNGKPTDLNTVLPKDSGWTLYIATGINAKGQIVGFGEHNGQYHAFLLDPKG